MTNNHANCDHANGVCFTPVTSEDYPRVVSMAEQRLQAAEDFMAEFGR